MRPKMMAVSASKEMARSQPRSTETKTSVNAIREKKTATSLTVADRYCRDMGEVITREDGSMDRTTEASRARVIRVSSKVEEETRSSTLTNGAWRGGMAVLK